MKKLAILLLSLIMISWFACAPPVVFSEPQPQGYEPRNSFPVYYKGMFFCDSDSSTVYVKDKLVYKEKMYSVVLTLAEIDSIDEVELVGSDLVIEPFGASFPATITNDSVFSKVMLSDTLFQIGKDQILTQFRGHQVLNKRLHNGDWEVMILSVDYNLDLVLSTVVYPEDLDRLNEITPVTELSTGDTVQYKISPTVYEFQQILEEQLIFEACDFYKRIALPIEI